MNEAILPALHAALTFGVLLSAPRILLTPRWIAGVLWIGACVAAAHLSRGFEAAAFAWAAAFAPFLAARVFERGILPPLALLLNGHLGALLVSRLLLSLPADAAAAARPRVVFLALLAAAAAVALAFVESRPGRVLVRLMAGHGALILAGLACGNAAGAAGALALWQSAAVATVMLACICAGIEARIGRETLNRGGFLGLAASAPRLAVFFALAALALAGLPLTMGFPAAELLLRGLLEAGPAGLAAPAIGALGAFVALRLFAALFWGRPLDAARGMPDALPRERWVLGAALLYLVIGGLFPSALLP